MPTLPDARCSLLVRTDFTNDEAWRRLCEAAQRETEEGFAATVGPVSDAAFDGATWETVRAAVPPDQDSAAVLFIADATALNAPDYPILVVYLLEDLVEDDEEEADYAPFRCIAAQLWGVENNLNIANMDWAEFADSTDEDGVFRDFT